MNRKALLQELDDMVMTYCKGCFVHKTLRKENGKRYAHRFCISKCTVGEKLQEYGKKL
ncbi:MAG TPA: zinc-finger domain-containing protein [Bacillus sp. (in: firmicutes)]|uniref:zinc-finger domain-containing protein n=1 Tax=Bacillus litorisediminis TaxID=2922713 RepID=UPI001FABB4E0|nr:zinc-finger domain-containing protein [Bacillus litorisediminis]HWO76332.1 zinc-finger domain-containing protein [Bacillus sp. (in: firmicutes)]